MYHGHTMLTWWGSVLDAGQWENVKRHLSASYLVLHWTKSHFSLAWEWGLHVCIFIWAVHLHIVSILCIFMWWRPTGCTLTYCSIILYSIGTLTCLPFSSLFVLLLRHLSPSFFFFSLVTGWVSYVERFSLMSGLIGGSNIFFYFVFDGWVSEAREQCLGQWTALDCTLTTG